MLAQLEQRPLYNAFNFNWGIDVSGRPADQQTVHDDAGQRLPLPVRPERRRAAATATTRDNNYFACIGRRPTRPAAGHRRREPVDVPTHRPLRLPAVVRPRPASTDGTSNTIAFGESTVGSATRPAGTKNDRPDRCRRRSRPAALVPTPSPAQAAVMAGIQAATTPGIAAHEHRPPARPVLGPRGDGYRPLLQHDRAPPTRVRTSGPTAATAARAAARSSATPTATTPAA